MAVMTGCSDGRGEHGLKMELTEKTPAPMLGQMGFAGLVIIDDCFVVLEFA